MPEVERHGGGWPEPARAGRPSSEHEDNGPYSAQPLLLWRESLVAEFLAPRMGAGMTALEVGPGAGDWTERIIGSVQTLLVADRRARTLEGIQQRFGHRPDLRVVQILNHRLIDVADGSVDLAYSLDFFPLVDWSVLDEWLGELSRVLRPGGHLVVHHAAMPRRLRTVSPRREQLRATRTSPSSRGRAGRQATGGASAAFTDSGLVTTRQTSCWGPSGEFTVDKYRDVITVARKPTANRQVPTGLADERG